jgi:hypothetical protein
MGIILIDFIKSDKTNDMKNWMGSIERIPITILLQLNVNITSWNEYQWCKKPYTKYEIVKTLYNILILPYII